MKPSLCINEWPGEKYAGSFLLTCVAGMSRCRALAVAPPCWPVAVRVYCHPVQVGVWAGSVPAFALPALAPAQAVLRHAHDPVPTNKKRLGPRNKNSLEQTRRGGHKKEVEADKKEKHLRLTPLPLLLPSASSPFHSQLHLCTSLDASASYPALKTSALPTPHPALPHAPSLVASASNHVLLTPLTFLLHPSP